MKNFVNNQSFWDELYKNGNVGWDMKSSTPVFKSILKEQNFQTSDKLLILGSGFGYDAVEAAESGFDVTAVDFSKTAIEKAREIARKQDVKINFLVRDFFTLTEDFKDHFDIVYDYVTYCAIDPLRRKEYAEMVSTILKCNGTFMGLWFPVENRNDGPPFGINLNETQNIFSKHLELQLTLNHKDTIKPRRGREVLQVYKKLC